MNSIMLDIIDKASSGERLTYSEGVELMGSYDLMALGLAADMVCQRLHPKNYRTYAIDRNINYTNICLARCMFCAFYRDEDSPDAYVISESELFHKIEETLQLGGTHILMQGGLAPGLRFDYYLHLLRSIKECFKIHIHAFSPPEIIHFTTLSRLSVHDVILTLKDAGLDSIPGGGAEILVDECRQALSPRKCSVNEWLEVMREAHRLGIKTTATMMFGHIERPEDRITHLERIRTLQDETGGFTAFIPWTFQPKNTQLSSPSPSPLPQGERDGVRGELGGFEYLKMLAISRLYLDNIPNIQASWVTQGAKIAQLALRFGANDMGSTMIEENVVRAAGITYRMKKEEMIRLIEDLGFEAKQRDCLYRVDNDVHHR
ncbi:MAG: cyclic dehypoxanthinyl futalosine synthase [Candidatus Brocadiales bacterium]|nr:cyclic dehypoxanthinyl futalosine synthase [Candidatus Brocadiales bacterium]